MKPVIAGPPRASDIVRFFAKVRTAAPHECWVWTGARTNADDQHGCGHGRFHYNGELVMATWFMWAVVCAGRLPEGAKRFLLHRCNNPPCVNPRHLYPGSLADNAVQMYEQGRGPNNRGSRHGRAKLTEAKVIEIRTRRAMGVPCAELAAEFGVSVSLIQHIQRRLVWTHV